MNIENPRERLIYSYDHYMEKVWQGEGKRYRVLLYQNGLHSPLFDTVFLAYNREHLFMEVANYYMLESIGIDKIEIEELIENR